MTRLFIASIAAAIGYLLLYAGVADGGRFALEPWKALDASANPPAGSSSSSSSDGGGGVLDTITGIGEKIVGGVIPGLP